MIDEDVLIFCLFFDEFVIVMWSFVVVFVELVRVVDVEEGVV